jgi:uncharacterized membrane protein YidH (DUF202 family)
MNLKFTIGFIFFGMVIEYLVVSVCQANSATSRTNSVKRW